MEVKRAMQEGSAASSGFSVRLEGASLLDLVQFECLDHERKLLRVSAGARTGFLYFRGGNLVHAATSDLVGEAAFRAMLGWKQGHVTHAEGMWPQAESITASWQSLLIRIAHAEDEAHRSDNVVSFPGRDAPATGSEGGMPDDPGAGDDAIHVVHVASDGEVRAAVEDCELAETLAFVVELADLVGEAFAVGHASSLEIWTSDRNLVLVREPRSGDLRAAWAPKDVEAARLKARVAHESSR